MNKPIEHEVDYEVIQRKLAGFSDIFQDGNCTVEVFACVSTFCSKKHFLCAEGIELIRFSREYFDDWRQLFIRILAVFIPTQNFASFRIGAPQTFDGLLELVGDFGSFDLLFVDVQKAGEVELFLTHNNFERQKRFLDDEAHLVYGVDTDDSRIDGSGAWEFFSYGSKILDGARTSSLSRIFDLISHK